MRTIFSPLASVAAAPPALAGAADVRLTACAAVVCITDSAVGLP